MYKGYSEIHCIYSGQNKIWINGQTSQYDCSCTLILHTDISNTSSVHLEVRSHCDGNGIFCVVAVAITKGFNTHSWRQRQCKQELHSSRMHAARLLTVSPSMHCAGGVSLLGESPCQGDLPCQGVYLPGGSALPGVSPCQGGWVVIPACTEADPPLWTESHTCVKT